MNCKQHNKSQDHNTEELKQIPKWTRKYAQNRTLTVLVLTAMVGLFGVLFGALVGLPLVLAGIFGKGNIILGCVGIAVSVAILVAYFKCLSIFVRKFGGKNRGLLGLKIDQWIYGREGMTSMPMPEETKKKKRLGIAVSIVWWCLFMGTTCLGMVNFIPAKYVQPVSALYMVPWFVFVYFLQRPGVGPLFLICPILYTIHAILIVAGVPMFFTGGWCSFSIVLPFFGYWFLAYVIGHLYSRYALKKLKGIIQLEGEAANGD
jgi:hypothetical protein